MATVVKRIIREDVINLMLWMKWNNCVNWDNERLADKLLQVKNFLSDGEEPDDEDVANTLIQIVAAIEDGEEFEVVDELEPEVELENDENDENDENEDDGGGEVESEGDFEVEPESEDELEESEEEQVIEPKEEEIAEEKPEKKRRGRGKGKKKKEEPKPEPEKEKEPDLHYKTYASAVPKFEVIEELTVAQAEEYLRANVENRPYRSGIAKRYAEDILRGKWKLTLETIIFDENGVLTNGQHKLNALINAEEIRAKDPDYYKEAYGWEGEVTMPVTLAFGADPEGTDLQDRGQQRSAADVLFRREEFKDVKESVLKKLSRDLAVAARLCWLKLGGKDVSDAPHFPHSEMLDFIEKHPKLKEMVLFVHNADGGKDKRVVTHLRSRGYLAGLAYLFGISETVTWDEPDFSKWETAEDFVSKFAAGVFDDEGNPIFQLREWLTREMGKPQKPSRDMKIDMIIKVWKAYIAGDSLEPKQMRFKKKEDLSIGTLA